jgi:ComF family protein
MPFHASELVARFASAAAPPLCWACRGRAPPSEPLCRACRRAIRWLGTDPVRIGDLTVWAPVAYEGPATALVRALKYRGAAPAGEAMGAQIAANASPELLHDAVLVPVPLHPARRRRRGFNQAEAVAMALARRRALEVSDCLERSGKAGATQVGRPRSERLRAIEGAVAVGAGVAVPRRAVLVDDVVTTGATLVACAAALRVAGSEAVTGIAYARTPGR